MQDEETCETLVKIEFKISNINRSGKLKEKTTYKLHCHKKEMSTLEFY